MEKKVPVSEFLLSVAQQDEAAVVICNLDHEIVYMNPAAEQAYQKWGGGKLLGKSVLDCHNPQSREAILKILDWFRKSEENNKVHTFYSESQNKDVYMVALRSNERKLIGYYEKHEYRTKDDLPFYKMD